MPARTPCREVIEHRLRQAFAGQGDGDAGRIGSDHLGVDPAGCLGDGYVRMPVEVGVPGQAHLLQPEVGRRRDEDGGRVPQLGGVGGEIAQRGDKAFGGFLVVGVGELGPDTAVVVD